LGFAAQCDPPYTQPEETADIRRIVRDLAEKEAAKQASSADPLAPFKVLSESPLPLEIDATLREAVKSLGRVDSLRLQTVRQEMIAHLKTRKVSGAAQYVDAALSLIADGGGMDGDHADFLADPEPWAEPIEGAILLDTISGVLRRYMVMTTEQADTCALWVQFGHTHDAFQVSPILAVQSPVMGCGKSRLFSLLEPMLPRALMACNLGAATLFRTVENYKPTLLIDEADTFMKDNEGLRGIVNSGWLRSSAQTIRLVGDDHETKIFSTWCPKAIAAIGKLPPTIQDRSIVIEIKRKAAREKVERLRRREANELQPLCRKAARWAKDSIETLREATPEVPDSLSDRQADSWSPLLAIADLVGGSWPKRARKAALMLSGGERDPEVDGAGVALIADCVTVFKERDRLSTAELITELVKLEERPWGEWTHGKPITPRGLAKLLKPFGIKPKVLRIGADTPSGYELVGFGDAHSRYVQGSHPQHCQQVNDCNELDPTINPQQTPHVEDTKHDLTVEKQGIVEDVEDRNPEFCGEEGIEAELDVTDPAFEARCAVDLGDLFSSEEVII
jgi:putative DNA primase/helicase